LSRAAPSCAQLLNCANALLLRLDHVYFVCTARNASIGLAKVAVCFCLLSLNPPARESVPRLKLGVVDERESGVSQVISSSRCSARL